MKTPIKSGLRWLALVFILFAGPAFANNFLQNGVVSTTGQTLPGTKINAPNPPNVPANEQVTATEFNTVTGALNDISSFLLPVTGLVDAGQALATNPAFNLIADAGFFGAAVSTSTSADAGFFGNMTVLGGSTAWPYSSNANPATTFAGPMYSMTQVGDFDSLIPSRIANKAWNQSSGPNNCSTGYLSVFAQTTDGGQTYLGAGTSPYNNGKYISAVEQNPNGFAGTNLLWAQATPPPGATGWTLNAYLQQGPAQQADGGIRLGFLDSACVGSHNVYAAITPTSTMTSYGETDTPTAATVYVPYIEIPGNLGVGDPIVGNVQLKPTGIPSDAGVFAGDFWRIGADPKLLWYNYLDSTVDQHSGGTLNQSPGTEIVIDTDAQTIVLELQDTNSSSGYSIGVWVNGEPYKTIISVSNVPEFHSIDLPSGMKKVEIGNGRNNFTAVAFGSYGQVMIRAIYAPASATTWVESEPLQKQRIIVYSDSTAWGDYNFNEPHASLVGFLRRIFPGTVYSEVIGGRALYIDTTNVATDAGVPYTPSVQTMVDNWAKLDPTAIWLAQLNNDLLDTYWTAAQFGTTYGYFMDALHARLPQAKIFMQTVTITTHEAATNGNGETRPNFRTAETNACNARPWCTLIDGTTIITTSELTSDGIHPNPSGMQVWAQFITTTIDNAPTTTNPLDWATNSFHSVIADAGFVGSVQVGVGSTITNAGFGTCNLASGTCNAVVLGATGSSFCLADIQGQYARDAGGVTCHVQADAGSASVFCQGATDLIDPATGPVAIHCFN